MENKEIMGTDEYGFGQLDSQFILSALLMGFGMSLLMSELGALFTTQMKRVLGLSCGIIGMAGVIVAWPLYQAVLKKERKKAAPQILKLTDELRNP